MYGTGRAAIDVSTLTAGAYEQYSITYTTGEYGVDDTGEILIARRDVCDAGIPQFTDPCAPDYVTVESEADCKLAVSYAPDRHIRPWRSGVLIRVTQGSLSPGDTVTVRFGGVYGFRTQTFAETEHIVRVLVDCAGSGGLHEIDESPVVGIVAGPAAHLQLTAPPLVAVGQPFRMQIRAIDTYGNVTGFASLVRVPGYGIRGHYDDCFILDQGIAWIEGVTINKPGIYRFQVTDTSAQYAAESNPIVCRETLPLNLYAGDMHGQTQETVGTGTQDEYFSHARDKAMLDFCAWQGNDFQVTDETYAEVCQTVKRYHEPGRFVTFLGYEYSATTPTGGDYNVYFLKDDQPMHRSYHWIIGMEDRDGTERNPVAKLWDTFRGRDDVMAIPHVGGRHGNLDMLDPALCPALEIHSHHGTFDWFFHDALAKGLRLGIVAASDDHTCRPGLSYPTRKTSRGFVSFDVNGGYTFVYAKDLTRQSLWEAIKARHTYGTTGERIFLSVTSGGHMMGDGFTAQGAPSFGIEVAGTGAIAEIQVLRGSETIYRYSGSLPRKPGGVTVQYSGVRSRARAKAMPWTGRVAVKGAAILSAEPFAYNQPDEGITLMSNQTVCFQSATSGDIDGFDLEVTDLRGAAFTFASQNVSFAFDGLDVMAGRIERKVGGVNGLVEVFQTPEAEKRDVSMTFTDHEALKGQTHAYWVKVTQKDGHMAWSSPMYIEVK